jgi:sporulation-control protein spo0M
MLDIALKNIFISTAIEALYKLSSDHLPVLLEVRRRKEVTEGIYQNFYGLGSIL